MALTLFRLVRFEMNYPSWVQHRSYGFRVRGLTQEVLQDFCWLLHKLIELYVEVTN